MIVQSINRLLNGYFRVEKNTLTRVTFTAR